MEKSLARVAAKGGVMKPIDSVRAWVVPLSMCIAMAMTMGGITQAQAQAGKVTIGRGVGADIFRDDLCWDPVGYIRGLGPFSWGQSARDFQHSISGDAPVTYTSVDAPSGQGKTVKAAIIDKNKGATYEFIRVPCPPPQTAPPDYGWRPFSTDPADKYWPGGGWAGPFAGVQVVGEWSGVTTSEFNGAGVRTFHSQDFGSGVGGGVNLGWNWQPWNPSTVVGIVLDANGLNDRVRHDFAGGNYIGSDMNFTGSAQVRGGMLVNPSFLLYVQTGVSVANQQLKIDFGGPETNESRWTPGYTLGLGAEVKLPMKPLPFARSMSLFAEYSHTWWDTANLRMPVASPLFDYGWLRQTDAVKFGARVSWGDGAPR